MWLKGGKGKGKGDGKGGGGGWHQQPYQQQPRPPNWQSGWQSYHQKGGGKGSGKGDKGKHGKGDKSYMLDSSMSNLTVEQQLQQLKALQKQYEETKKKCDEANWADDYEHQPQQSSSSGADHHQQHHPYDQAGYWSMYDRDAGWSLTEADGEAGGSRAFPPLMGKDYINNLSRKLGSVPTMHAKISLLHAHLDVPVGHKLNLIPVDSGCTVTNIDDDSIIHADHRMSASRPFSVASKDAEAIYPDYEGFGQITTYSKHGGFKNIRMGRCIRAPSVKNLLSVTALAKKGHECVLNTNNPRVVCKDGIIVPLYYFDDLFYLPYITPTDGSSVSGGSRTVETYGVDESHLLSSNNTADDPENSDPAEAIVRLDARPSPENRIVIDPEISDGLVTKSDDDRARVVHHMLGHASSRKMAATSAAVDGMPKYSRFDTWCTSCHKARWPTSRMHMTCGMSEQLIGMMHGI